MCKKNKKRYMSAPITKPHALTIDAETLISMLKIRIWQIIARNNADDLVDPMLNPLQNPSPYIQKARLMKQKAKSDVAVTDITPTLDEVLPLPQKADTKSAPKKKDAKPALKNSKKTSAKDLLADDDEETSEQITVDEVIAEAGDELHESKKETPTSNPTDSKTASSTQEKQGTEKDVEVKKLSLRERYISWKVQRAEEKDYFARLDVQIQNKNSACFEILEYLDELKQEG